MHKIKKFLNNVILPLEIVKNTFTCLVIGLPMIILVRVFLLSLFLYMIVYIAWISDDAHFTFKQILNFVNGQGIVYNFETRVQGFTHPLWFLILSILVFFSNEIYVTTIVTSIVLSFSAVFLLFAVENNYCSGNYKVFTPIIFLLFSWAFCDYTGSGLENPLSYFLTGCLLFYISKNDTKKYSTLLFLILALLVLTRFDYGIVFFPFALILLIECKTPYRIIVSVLPGIILLLLWHTFSTFYFGTPFPNTFYAKILAGYPTEEYHYNGLKYLLNMKFDILSIIIICTSIVFSFVSKNKYVMSLSAGIILYIIYIYNAGGDFMSGRFFSLLVFLSVGILVMIPSIFTWKKAYHIFVLSLLFILSFDLPLRYPFLASQYNTTRVPFDHTGAADERFWYYGRFGLLSDSRNGWPDIYNIPKFNPDEYFISCGGLGTYSAENPNVYVIDFCALVDPFLSKMPAVDFGIWRPGHNFRKIPTNFGEFLVGKTKTIHDRVLAKKFKDIDLVVRGDLVSFDRFKAIWRLNTNFDYGVDWKKYTDPQVWVTTSTYYQSEVIENWNFPLTNLIKNQNWKVTSKSTKIASNLLIDISFDYKYNVYVNDKLILTLDEGVHCDGGKLINFSNHIEVSSIKFVAIQVVPLVIPTSTEIKYLNVINPTESIPNIEPNCTYTAKNISG